MGRGQQAEGDRLPRASSTRELATREFAAGDEYSIADITGLVAIDFMKPARIEVPEELTNVLRWHQAISEPAERQQPDVADRASTRWSRRIRACRICVETPARPAAAARAAPGAGAVGDGASILIASQAPGTKVHLSGMPFTDASGDRLRDWLGVTSDEFYDPRSCSPSCRWASAFPARTPRAPTCRRAANARRHGARR